MSTRSPKENDSYFRCIWVEVGFDGKSAKRVVIRMFAQSVRRTIRAGCCVGDNILNEGE